ncbi:hypothetical protein PTKIN_Ptkin06aG0107900 [Pterospermum kingtungense]
MGREHEVADMDVDEQVKKVNNLDSDFHDSEYKLDDGDEEDGGGIKALSVTRRNNLKEEVVGDFHVKDTIGAEIEDDGTNDEVNVSEELFTDGVDDCEGVDQPKKEWPKFSVNDMDDPVFYYRAKCDILLSNLCETFNRFILDARERPILSMVENTRFKLMKKFYLKRNDAANYEGKICPKIQKKLDRNKALCGRYWPQPSTQK